MSPQDGEVRAAYQKWIDSLRFSFVGESKSGPYPQTVGKAVKMAKFSKWLFVTRKKDGDTSWLDANENQVDAVENADSDLATVATYQLIKVKKLRLVKTVAMADAKK